MEPEHDAPSLRMKQYLQQAKEARVTKEKETHENIQPANQQQDAKSIEIKWLEPD